MASGLTPDSVANTLHAGFLITVTAGIAWFTGEPFIFPSIGPSAYLLAVGDIKGGVRGRAYKVVTGHFVGVVAGFLAYNLFAMGLTVTSNNQPVSIDGLRLGLSSISSVSLTTIGMLELDARHAPACATTLIISLGLLSSAYQSAVIMFGVVAVFAADGLVKRFLRNHQ